MATDSVSRTLHDTLCLRIMCHYTRHVKYLFTYLHPVTHHRWHRKYAMVDWLSPQLSTLIICWHSRRRTQYHVQMRPPTSQNWHFVLHESLARMLQVVCAACMQIVTFAPIAPSEIVMLWKLASPLNYVKSVHRNTGTDNWTTPDNQTPSEDLCLFSMGTVGLR